MRLRRFVARRRAVLSAAIASAVGLSGLPVRADLLTWDANGASPTSPVGGPGTWDTTTARWSNGATNLSWNNAALDTALFAGSSAGTVTINTASNGVVVGGLTFNTAGYTIAGASATELLTLGGVTNTLGGTGNAVISAGLAGTSGFTKAGGNSIVLTGNNAALAGNLLVTEGTLGGVYTSGQSVFGSGTIQLGNATLELSPIANTAAGLSGRQFASTIPDTARIDFTQVANSVRIDNALGLTQANNLAGGQAVQWIGKIAVSSAGLYTFQVGSDDGSRLWIDGVLVVQNDGAKGVINGTSAPIQLAPGLHDVRIDYVNSGGNGGINFNYSGPDTADTFVAVPNARLRQAETNTTAGASNAVILGTGIGNSLAVSGDSTIRLNGTQFTQTQLGQATFASGSKLNLVTPVPAPGDEGATGKSLRLAGPTSFGSDVTLNLAGDGTYGADLYLDGTLSDGGVATTITKTGAGRLVLNNIAGHNLSAGTNFNIQAGVLHLTGSSAAGAQNPIGAAGITLAGGNLVLDARVGSTATPIAFNNAIAVTENATIQDIVTGGSVVTLGGPINVAAGKTLTIDAIRGGNPANTSFGATLNVGGPLSGAGRMFVTSTGIGTLPITPASGIVNLLGTHSGFTGTLAVGSATLNINNPAAIPNASLEVGGAATLAFQLDGDGTGRLETFNLNNAVTLVAGGGTIAVNRQGTSAAPLFTSAANKTVRFGSLTTGGNPLTIANSNNYGVLFAGPIALTGTDVFTVNTATATTVNPGLVLAGQITGSAGLIKRGSGTIVLTNSANATTFSGPLSIQAGVLAANSDAALGGVGDISIGSNIAGTASTTSGSAIVTVASTDGLFPGMLVAAPGVPANTTIASVLNATQFTLSTNATATNPSAAVTYTATGAFTALGTFTTGRNFTFLHPTNTSNSMNVAAGQTLTVTSPLTGTTGFQKADSGTLVLSSNGSTITGPIAVAGGALRVTRDGALGTTTALTVLNNEGAALQIDGSAGSVTLARPLNLNNSGIQNNGALQNFAGNNTVSGAITIASAATIGNSAAGTTLTLTGGISGAQALTFNGPGDIDISGTALGGVNGISRNGSGTTTLRIASSPFTAAMTVNGGRLVLAGDGAVANATAATTVTAGGSFVLDNSSTARSFRLNVLNAASTRTMSLSSGTFRFVGGSAPGTLTETMGALTSAGGNNTIRIDPGATNNTITFASLAGNAVSANSVLLFTAGEDGNAAAFGSNASRVIFTTAPTLTNGLIQRSAVFDNSSGSPQYNFATHVAGTGIIAFTGYNAGNNINTAAATDTHRLTASHDLTDSRAANALAFAGNVTLNAVGQRTLSLTTGNVLVQSGTATIGSNVIVALGSVEGGLLAAPGATLNVNGPITSSTHLTTGLGGTVRFGTRQFFNTGTNAYLTVNRGTVVLAGGDNTLFAGQAAAMNQNLSVAPGGTLDLNGNVQVAGNLQNPGNQTFFGAGGTVTSTTPAVFVSRQADSNWGGIISGPVTFVMGNSSATRTQRFYADNTYTGRTAVVGGTLELTDQARLSGTTGIDINYATLLINNQSANNGRSDLPDRVNDAAGITLRGGFVRFIGRPQTDSSESLGVVTLAQGVSNLRVASGGTGGHSAVLTLADLQRTSSNATLNINTESPSGTGVAGGQLGPNPRLIITSRETAPNLTNNIVGGWAVSGGAEFISYVPTLGLAAVNAPGFPGYNQTSVPVANDPTSNVRLTGGGNLPAGGLQLNSLVVNGTLTFAAAGDTLNLTSGGVLKSIASAINLGGSADFGRITAGGPGASGLQSLYLHNNATSANIINVNARVIDNGSAPVRLVVTGYNGGVVTLASGSNSYTGGTAVNGWNDSAALGGLTIAATGRLPAPASGVGVILNNAILTQTAGGVIEPQSVEMNGASTINLAGNNTLTSLTIKNNGGYTAPTVNTGGTLTLTGSIAATSQNVGTLPVINGTLDFGGTARTLAIEPIAYNERTLTAIQPTLNITATIQNAGQLTVDGGGRLQLSGQSTFAGGVLLKTGSGLVLGASSAAGAGNTVASGPLGTGTLTLEANTTLLSTAAVTIGNALNILGDIRFDGLNNLTFTGATTIPGSPFTIHVAAPQQTVAIVGQTSGPAGLITKTGYGNLILGSSLTTQISMPGGGTLSLLNDGDGTGTPNTISYASGIVSTGTTTLNVGRFGTTFAPYFPSAVNKLIQVPSLDVAGNALTINNADGYGLEVTGAMTLPSDQIIAVTNASISTVTPGAIISGAVSGPGGIVKQGAGILLLANAGNSFGGTGKSVDISAGFIAAATDGALGDGNNDVRLNTNSGLAGFRAVGTFSTGRTFTLNQAANAIDVSQGNTLTLTAPFNAVAATNALTKNDNGVLVMNANNAGWSGAITINDGVVRAAHNNAMGSGTVSVAPSSAVPGAALQLAGVNIANTVTLQGTGNTLLGGVNGGGQLQAFSGVNTTSGQIQMSFDAAIGAEAGAVLNIAGGIHNPTTSARALAFVGNGTINLNSAITSATATANQYFALVKFGSGTLDITADQGTFAFTTGSTQNITVNAGTLRLSQAGTLTGTAALPLQIQPGATATLDNTAQAVANRLGGRAITVRAGTFNFIGNASGASETLGALSTAIGGAVYVNSIPQAAGVNALTFSSLALGADSAVIFGGANLGSANNRIRFTTSPTTNNGLIQRGFVDTGSGVQFAAYDTTAGIIPLTLTATANLNTGTLTTTNVAVSSNQLITGGTNRTVNAMRLSGAGVTIDAGPSTPQQPTTLTLGFGGLLVSGGTHTMNVPVLQTGNGAQTSFFVESGSTLTLNALLAGGSALNKNGPGTLVLNTPDDNAGIPNLRAAVQLAGTTIVSGGTLRLGETNALNPGSYFRFSAGGTFDTNGRSQLFRAILTDIGRVGYEPNGALGEIVNSAVAQSTVVMNHDATDRDIVGRISGNIFLGRSGSNTTNFYADLTYTGGTLINGGGVQLIDFGRLSGTSAIDINAASLTLNNGGMVGMSGRLNPAAAIALRNGTLNVAGQPRANLTETAGVLISADGFNTLNVTTGGTGVNSMTMNFASLARPAGSGSVLRLNNESTLGLIGNNPRVTFTAAPTLTNNIIGPWAIIDREWLSHIDGLGVGSLRQAGFAGYAANTLTGTPLPTDNIRINTGGTLTLGTSNVAVNTLLYNVTSAATLDLNGRSLALAGGGLSLGQHTNNTTTAVNNGTVTSGYANGAVNELYLHFLPYGGTGRVANIGALVADNGTTPVRLIVSSSEAAGTTNRVTLNAANTYSGGTVINQGTLLIGATGVLPAGGVTINSGVLDQQIGGQATRGVIQAGNVVTLNGQADVRLAGDNTLAGLVFNNDGGTVAPVVNTFKAGLGTDGRGTLSLGSAGIVARSSNPANVSSIVGRLDTGTGLNLDVQPVSVNGVAIAPLTPSLNIQGLIGGGEITKTGTGVVGLTAQQTFTGRLNVVAGGVSAGLAASSGSSGVSQAGSRFANLNLAAGTFFNLADTDATFGSLSGAGNVINASATAVGATVSVRTFNVGFDNTSTTFAGSFSRVTDAMVNPIVVQKLGTGTMTLTGQSTTTNTLQVSRGGVTFSGSGTGVFGTYVVLPAGSLTLDNTAANIDNRLGGSTATLGALGTLTVRGNAAAATSETVGTLTFARSAGENGPSTITLQPNAAQPLTLTVATTFGGLSQSTGLIRGVSATSGPGSATLSIGALTLGGTAGTGLNGSTSMPIRPDLIGDASPAGLGTAFVTKDSASNNLRPLSAAEQLSDLQAGVSAGSNHFALSSPASLALPTAVASLNLSSGGGIATPAVLRPAGATDGLPIAQTISSGGILARGGNAGITAGRLTTAGNLYIHAVDELLLTATLTGQTGISKAGPGNLTLAGRSVSAGTTAINGGTLTLAGGVNTLPATIGTAGVLTAQPIAMNGPDGVLNLNGSSQLAGTLLNNNSVSRLAGTAGAITNTAGGPAVALTTIPTAASTTATTINGNLNFSKTGNHALTLTSAQGYTGATFVRGNTLTLAEAATITGSSAVQINYAGLTLDHTGLTPLAGGTGNPTRIAIGTPVTLRGGTLTLTPGGSNDTTQTFGTVSADQGHSTLAVPVAPAAGFGAMTVNNLQISPDATVNLTGGTGGFFSNLPGLGQSHLFIGSINGQAIPATITGKILGGNVLTNNGEFATYVQSGTAGSGGMNIGVMPMNGVAGAGGTIAQNQYDATAITAAGNATTNVRITASSTLVSGGTTYNALAIRPAGTAAAITVTYAAATNVLNLASGGVALTNTVASNFGASADAGQLTAGGTQSTGTARLYFHSAGANHNLHARVIDNAAGARVRLIVNAINNTLTLTAPNTYTGGTVINGAGGSVALGGAANVVVIPAGGLTLNNTGLTMLTNAGQIAATNDVTINGGGTLTLVGSNTLASVTFNTQGGVSNPAVAVGSNLTLSAGSAVTAVNDNAAVVPTISGTLLTLPAGGVIDASSTVSVPTALAITSPIASSGAISKSGNAALVLSGASNFAGGLNVNAGAIVLGANSTGTAPAITAGPVGTGTLTLADGVALLSDSAVRSIGNPVTLTGNVTFGSNAATGHITALAANSVTLNGVVNLGAATRTIEVNSFLNVSTINGVVGGGAGAGLTKAGPGTLVLNGSNTFAGPVSINGGTLTAGVAGALGVATSPGSIVFGGGILHHAAGNTADYSTRFSSASNQPFMIDTGTNTVQYAAGLTSAVGGSLTKFGSGTLVLSADASFDGITTIVAGTLQAGTGGVAGRLPAGTTIASAGTLVWNTSTDDTLSGVMSGATGRLTKTGVGTLRLAGANTYGGDTTVTAGVLLAANTAGSATGTGNVAVAGGATLGGTGSIAGGVSVAASGRLSPGVSPGVLTIGGPVVLAANSTFDIELAGTSPGNAVDSYDQLRVDSGSASVGNAVLRVASVNDFMSADPAQAYFILVNAGLTPVNGQFVDTSGNVLSEGAIFTFPDGFSTGRITYQANWTGTQAGSSLTGGNDVALFNVNVVPEPATVAAAGLAAVGLLARRRRSLGR